MNATSSTMTSETSCRLRDVLVVTIHTAAARDLVRAVVRTAGLHHPTTCLAVPTPAAVLLLAPDPEAASAAASAAVRLIASGRAHRAEIRRADPETIARAAASTDPHDAAVFFGQTLGLDFTPVVARRTGPPDAPTFRILRPALPREAQRLPETPGALLPLGDDRFVLRPADWPEGAVSYSTLGGEPWP